MYCSCWYVLLHISKRTGNIHSVTYNKDIFFKKHTFCTFTLLQIWTTTPINKESHMDHIQTLPPLILIPITMLQFSKMSSAFFVKNSKYHPFHVKSRKYDLFLVNPPPENIVCFSALKSENVVCSTHVCTCFALHCLVWFPCKVIVG